MLTTQSAHLFFWWWFHQTPLFCSVAIVDHHSSLLTSQFYLPSLSAGTHFRTPKSGGDKKTKQKQTKQNKLKTQNVILTCVSSHEFLCQIHDIIFGLYEGFL